MCVIAASSAAACVPSDVAPDAHRARAADTGALEKRALETAGADRHPSATGADSCALGRAPVCEEGVPTPPEAPTYDARAVYDAALTERLLPGAPEFDARRETLLMRAKGEPAFFVREPSQAGTSSNQVVASYQRRLATTAYPWDVLQQLLPRFRQRPELGREVLLREGYLYTTDPELAFALVSLVEVSHLFGDEHVWVQRGDGLMRATRRSNTYVYDDGTLKGQPVKLLLFDRLGVGDGPSAPALHRDFRSLAYRLGFDRVEMRRVSARRILADLRYGEGLWVPSILRSRGPHLELEWEDAGARERDLQRARTENLARIRATQRLRHAVLQQVEEQLPFDEPRNEVGQEDGILRRSFRFVYGLGRDSFRIRSDRYEVFDRQGRPLPPQVCIDFLLDTIERASGTWWARKGEVRTRHQGRLNFEDYVPRDLLRRTEVFIEFAKAHPELFEVLEIPAEARVLQGYRARFFGRLAQEPELFRPGDMAIIRGPTPWDPRREHYHSFFVYETDPISGVPIAIAGNAGSPAIWSWESEARRTPQRSLRYRIRPSTSLLEQVAGADPPGAPTPPPLVWDDASEV